MEHDPINTCCTVERTEKGFRKKDRTLAGRKGRYYSAKNKAAWPDLFQTLEAQLLENKISYLNRPPLTRGSCHCFYLSPVVPKPNFVVFIIPSPYEKEHRDLENDVLKKMYSDALSRQISELKLLQRDNEVRLSILLDLVDKAINDELHDFKKRTCGAMTPEQQYDAIFQHLLMTHRPHSSLDVRSLTAQLSELSPTALGYDGPSSCYSSTMASPRCPR